MESLLDFVEENNFNVLRIPLAVDNILNNPTPGSINFAETADLQGLNYFQVLDVLVEKAAARGLLIMFDMHRLDSAVWPDDGLWYNWYTPEQHLIDAWQIVVQRYCGTWNVIATDLYIEPHGSSWGLDIDDTDWDAAATRIGGSSLETCPRLLIVIEGIDSSPGAIGQVSEVNSFWGENLQGVRERPVALPITRIIYSPHVYGPSVYMQNYFSEPDFPQNMPAIWDVHFGFVQTELQFPLWVGEWGGRYAAPNAAQGDDLWHEALTAYLLEHSIGSFYWCLNPNSGDTGGLLQGDWRTPEQRKLDLLAQFPSTNVRDLLA